jgi:cyanophycinase
MPEFILRVARSLACVVLLVFAACAGPRAHPGSPPSTNLQGHLLLIGGGLDDDNKPVYERFITLASTNLAPGQPPRILIATAASGDQEANVKGKTESLRAYCPAAKIDAIRRETPTDETVALIDQCTAIFFTGGDQKRITTRYLTLDGLDTPESLAMRRLLARGGVIAGTSAGDAMMSDPMFFTGRSAEALGIRSTRTQRAPDDDDDEKRSEIPLGPQIGKGMGFLPWAVTDSHFFERHRFGRLVAALEHSGMRLGLGVGEDACTEIDLSTGDAIGISVADSLLVDAGAIQREGPTRRHIRTTVLTQGKRVNLPAILRSNPPVVSHADLALQAADARRRAVETSIVEPGQNRQLASWRFFTRAQEVGGKPQLLKLDAYQQLAWPDGAGWAIVEISPSSATTPSP